MRDLKKTIGWKRIFYGNYEMNRRGKIRRVTAAHGTHPGRFLHPYEMPGSTEQWVKLHRNGDQRWQVPVSQLLARHFPAHQR